jgi:hypothetical protein
MVVPTANTLRSRKDAQDDKNDCSVNGTGKSINQVRVIPIAQPNQPSQTTYSLPTLAWPAGAG